MEAWYVHTDHRTDEMVWRDCRESSLLPHQVRIQVQYACLTPENLALATERAPGGGLVGVVAECGEAATTFAAARVLVSPVQACGECATCRRGFACVCPHRVVLGKDVDGGCASRIVADSRWLTRLDRGLESIAGPVGALIAGPGVLAYDLFARAGTGTGDIVIVLGKGPTARILARLAAARGAHVAAADGPGAVESVRNSLAGQTESRPQRIFVCDGASSLETALQIATPGSMITASSSLGAIDLAQATERQLMVLGIPYGHPDLMVEMAALIAKREIDVSELIVDRVLSSESSKHALAAFERGQCLVVRHGNA